MGRLDDRIIIVTGGALGIGRAYASGFVQEGGKVVVVDINAAAADQAASELIAEGGEAIAVAADVADARQTEEMARITLERFGRIDGLVNNAALGGMRMKQAYTPIEEIDPEVWDRVITVNLRGTYLCLRAVLPHMKDQNYGKILNISSATFFYGREDFSHYVASKGGVIGLTRSVARETGDFNITVNSIAPGLTASETDETPMSKYEARVPHRAIKRVEIPEDLIGAAVYFMSADSDFMTGQTLVVDGGIAMW
mgnify:CR=1 FL=1